MHLNAWHVAFTTSEVSTGSLPGWLEGSIKPGNMKEINFGEKKKCYKKYHKNLAQHIPLTQGCGFEASRLPRPTPCSAVVFWPVELRRVRNDHIGIGFPQNENRITVHLRVLVKTTPEVSRIIERTVVSLCSSMSAGCQAIGLGTSTFVGLQKTQKCPSNCSTFLRWKSDVRAIPCYNLATKHGEHAVHAVWRAVMDMFALFFRAAERRLVWKTPRMQLQDQTHAAFGFCRKVLFTI